LISALVDWSGRHEDSCPPAESEVPGAQINRLI
jgi:hypothetical protein